MLTYRNDPRFRTERLMILFAIPISIIVLIGVGFLAAIQLESQKKEMARLIAPAPGEEPTPVPIPATAVERGKTAFADKNFLAAKVELEQALEFPSQRSEAANFLGVIANHEGDFEKAVGYFNVALERSPQARLYFNRGEALRRGGHLPEAMADIRRAVEMEPGNPLFSNKLGFVRIANGEFVQVREEIRLKNEFGLTQAQKGWIFVEALLAMKAEHFSDSAACLNVAGTILPAATFSALIQDPELLAYQTRPELIHFYIKNQ